MTLNSGINRIGSRLVRGVVGYCAARQNLPGWHLGTNSIGGDHYQFYWASKKRVGDTVLLAHTQDGTLFRIHDLPLYALTSLPPWCSTECCELITNQIATPKSLDALRGTVQLWCPGSFRNAPDDALPNSPITHSDMHSSGESIDDSKVILLLP
jgi:hypothetical protein